MGLISEIQSRYSCGTSLGVTRLTLVHRKTQQHVKSPSIDMRRLSGELLRVTKPLMIAEFRHSAAAINAVHKKNAAELKKHMDSKAEKNTEDLGLAFARYGRRMEAYGERLFDDLARRQELILARVNSKLRQDAESKERSYYQGERPVSIRDVEGILEKRLGETGEELFRGAHQIARAEAEAALRRFREDEEYERLRSCGPK